MMLKCLQKLIIILLILPVQSFSTQPEKESSVQVIAHRGFSGKYPENTVLAVRKAAKLGVDYIEIDVHQSADGRVIVIHDATVDRTTNGSGRVSELTADEIQQLDAGSWKSDAFKGEKIPLLEDILPFISADIKLLLEVKKGRKLYEGIEQTILDILQEHGVKEHVVIQSFYTDVLKNFARLDPDLPLHKLGVYQSPAFPFYIDHRPGVGRMHRISDVEQLNLYHKFLNRRILRRISNKNLSVYTWTVNEPEDMIKMINLGVDGIITDYPDVLQNVLKKLNP